MMEVLSPGKRLKSLRKKVGLKQENLIDKTISKSLISMIEQDKRNLTPRTAKVIANQLNPYLKKLGIVVTPEYLLETKEEQIKRIIRENISEVREAIKTGGADEDLLNANYEKAIYLMGGGDYQEEVIDLKILRGDYYFYNYQYSQAVANYLDGLDNAIENNNFGQIARIYILLGSTYQMQMVLDNALTHYSKAYQIAGVHGTENKDKIKVQAIFNKILIYRELKSYDYVLDHINIFKGLKWNDAIFKVYANLVNLIEANTYRDLENWDMAESLYRRLFDDQEQLDSETLFLLYENFGLFYRNMGEMDKALEYLQNAYEYKENIEPDYLPTLFLYQASCYNLKEEYNTVIPLLKKGLCFAEKVHKTKSIIYLRFALGELYMELQEFDKALQQLDEAAELLEKCNVNPLTHTLYSYYIDCYCGLGDTVKILEYTYKIRNKNLLKG